MALKVSISLPGDTVITFEASDPEVFREVMGLALKELPGYLIQMQMAGAPATSRDSPGEVAEKNKDASPGPSGTGGTGGYQGNGAISSDTSEEGGATHLQQAQRGEGEESFARFCGSVSPLGDMRRVVVAAEGARRFLDTEAVSERELGHLFDLAGWSRPTDFLQVIRNASRSKFRWLERVRGSPGYYMVTEIGRKKVLEPRDK